MRLWIAGGGTGGHVYPALAVVKAIRLAHPDVDLRWIGSRGGVEEELVTRESVPFETIPAGGLHGVGWVRAAQNALRLLAGVARASRLARVDRPQAVLVTGGFVSVPVAIACWLRRAPIVVYLPDVEPGLAVKFVSRLATKVAVTVEESRRFVPPAKMAVTGYPTRPFVGATRAAAIEHFRLDPDRKTVLVFGGSRGARSLNRALGAILDRALVYWQVIHVSGTLDAQEAEARRVALPESLRMRYHLFPYLHEDMGLALAAADVVVSRSGASVLGEFPLFGLASILVPYPYAWRYQKVNADHLVSHGAAIRLNDEDLADSLWPALERLLTDDAARAQMQARSKSLARPDAAARLADLVVGLAGAEG